MIEEELKIRQLPDVLQMENGKKAVDEESWKIRRKEIAHILQHNYCGYVPPLRPHVAGEVIVEDENAFGGKACYQKINIYNRVYSGNADMRCFSFPCHFLRPKHVEKPPVFLYISFTSSVVDELIPMEEILDSGFAVASFYYQDVAPDMQDGFKNGVAAAYGRNPFNSWGKIRMWAWGASRVMDHLHTLDCIDVNRIAVVGHSRLGKTALVTGAFDSRFSLAISNDSGGGGAAIFRGKIGEKVENFWNSSNGHWFTGNFSNYAKKEDEMPFDMHYLLAMLAPRNLYVSSASEDSWADPKSEFLACVAASPVYETAFHKKGLVWEGNQIPKKEISLPEGNIGYHLRNGHHFLSRYDWQKFMEYRNMPEHIC